MKLSLRVKIMSGFALMLLLSFMTGAAGYRNIRKIVRVVHLSEMGSQILSKVQDCGAKRRDFSRAGFTNVDSTGKNSADLWKEEYERLMNQLSQIRSQSDLSDSSRQALIDSIKAAEEYQKSFEKLKDGKKLKDTASAAWTVVGGEVTSLIVDTSKNELDRQVSEALASGNIELLHKITQLSIDFEREFVQNFILMRVSAIYLIARESEEKWQVLQQRIQVCSDGNQKWKKELGGVESLQKVAEKNEQFLSRYRKAGEDYYNGLKLEIEAEKEMVKYAGAIVSSVNQLKKILDFEAEKIIKDSMLQLIVFLAVALFSGLLVAVILTGMIVTPLKRVVEALEKGSIQVFEASDQISQTSQNIAEGANEQASSLEETSASLEEISSMIRQTADNARHVTSLSDDASGQISRSRESMTKMAEAIRMIKISADQTAKILKTIDEIAFQTNLLALNAAVEAARAGEAGKGFAVVAEEVRSLAQRSAEAAKSTSELVDDSQKNADNGVTVTTEAEEIMQLIGEKVIGMNQLITEVSTATDEQAQGIEQINKAVSEMDKVVQESAACSEEAASSSEELSAQAAEMKEIVVQLNRIMKG